MNATRIRNSLPDAAWRHLETALAMPALLVTPARALEDIESTPGRLAPQFLESLVAGAERVRTGLAARAAHAPDLIAQLRLRQGDTGALPDACLRPADGAMAVALLRAAAAAGVAVGPRPDAPDMAHITLDLSALNEVETIDILSGQVRAGAGMTIPALEAMLAAKGLMLKQASSDPAMTVARRAQMAHGICGVRLASPMGLAATEDPNLAALLAGGGCGVVCAATLPLAPRPIETVDIFWHLPDFAAGLALLRESARQNLTLIHPLLRDEAAARFHATLTPAAPLWAALWARLRDRKKQSGATLAVSLARADAARFRRMAGQVGAVPLHHPPATPIPAPDAALLERGTAMDAMTSRASWAGLPLLYASARAALNRAMAQNAPRQGARGLVMATLEAPDAHGASLTLRWIFARRLGEEITQARAIRASARKILTPPPDPLAQAARTAVARALDPQGIMPQVY